MERITRMEGWGEIVDCTKQLANGISGIRRIRVICDQYCLELWPCLCVSARRESLSERARGKNGERV